MVMVSRLRLRPFFTKCRYREKIYTTMLYRRPIGSLLLAVKKPRLTAFQRTLEAFDAVQSMVLARAMAQISGSRFAMAHGARTTPRIADFPVCDYEDLRPWVDRFAAGDATSLFGPGSGITPGKCDFVTTSGSTGRPKLIPVTPESFAAQAAGWEAWGLATFADHRDAAFWDVLPVSSTTRASMSGLATWAMQPSSFKTLYAVPDEAQALAPFDVKLKALLRLTVANRNLGMLMAANPSTLLMLTELLARHGHDLVRDLRNGTFFAGPDALTARDITRLRLNRRDPRAARRLDAILKTHGQLTPKDVWPRLKLVTMWLGGTLAHYCEALRPALGHVPWRDHGLVASEGRFTIPLRDNSPDGVLDPRAAFYEFLTGEGQNSRLIQARDLIPGEKYRLVVTTLGGLIRYDMHDVVECRGFLNDMPNGASHGATCRAPGHAPVVRFLRKSSQFANVTGEKLSAAQVTEALTNLARDVGICGPAMRGTRFVTVAPDRDQAPPHYVLHAETITAMDKTVWEEVARKLDDTLAGLNFEYRDKRGSGRLGPVRAVLLRPGSLDELRARHLARSPGATPEQFKQPVLLDDITSPLRDMALQV